ncbi:MAG: hypothetical protein AB7G05_13365 [Hyphomonadaceae bacterium]
MFQLSGAAALAGGLLRMASALPLPLAPLQAEALWAVIDVLLTLGLIGVYLARAERLGHLGLAAFVLAIAALSFIGGPDADPFGFSTYEQGAATLVIALVGLSIAWLRAGERPLAPPLLWFASALAGGAMAADAAAGWAFMAAGLLFGAAFVAAGLSLIGTRSSA